MSTPNKPPLVTQTALKEGDRVEFERDWYHAVAGFELYVPAGSAATVRLDRSAILLHLDEHEPELDEWDNELHFGVSDWDDLDYWPELSRAEPQEKQA